MRKCYLHITMIKESLKHHRERNKKSNMGTQCTAGVRGSKRFSYLNEVISTTVWCCGQKIWDRRPGIESKTHSY